VPVAVPEVDLTIMRHMDEIHMEYPFMGCRRLALELADKGFQVNRKKVSRLMKVMRIEAVYPKKRTTIADKQNKIYPYLLRDLKITYVDQVWSTDITYIPMAKGFVYVVAIMDWHSRKVLSWPLSNTMDTQFCLDALDEAIRKYGKPEIFNTDQGSQFTSEAFTGRLAEEGIEISMDGKRRWIDNVFIERLWRSLKYEEVYLKAYETIIEAELAIDNYFVFYNERRKHQNLDRLTPDQVYHARQRFMA
jgi:putative transposase